ncbi:hypothetical protein H920_11615 [Fukomys damarensis]|uniref:Uncharacterized protein n=1 Tax=Fukomys damarensis TaxID=885580 RepID=A0A091D4G0_FUKDA|nr:hypothetical protein H920_11615 [Fukomys damarensis]
MVRPKRAGEEQFSCLGGDVSGSRLYPAHYVRGLVIKKLPLKEQTKRTRLQDVKNGTQDWIHSYKKCLLSIYFGFGLPAFRASLQPSPPGQGRNFGFCCQSSSSSSSRPSSEVEKVTVSDEKWEEAGQRRKSSAAGERSEIRGPERLALRQDNRYLLLCDFQSDLLGEAGDDTIPAKDFL